MVGLVHARNEVIVVWRMIGPALRKLLICILDSFGSGIFWMSWH